MKYGEYEIKDGKIMKFDIIAMFRGKIILVNSKKILTFILKEIKMEALQPTNCCQNVF